MSGKHTELPWHLDQYGGVITNSLNRVVVNGFALSSGPRNKLAEENTAFIIRACNAHDDLLASLQSILKAGRGTSGRIILESEDEEAIRAAIRKATGEKE